MLRKYCCGANRNETENIQKLVAVVIVCLVSLVPLMLFTIGVFGLNEKLAL